MTAAVIIKRPENDSPNHRVEIVHGDGHVVELSPGQEHLCHVWVGHELTIRETPARPT